MPSDNVRMVRLARCTPPGKAENSSPNRRCQDLTQRLNSYFLVIFLEGEHFGQVIKDLYPSADDVGISRIRNETGLLLHGLSDIL